MVWKASYNLSLSPQKHSATTKLGKRKASVVARVPESTQGWTAWDVPFRCQPFQRGNITSKDTQSMLWHPCCWKRDRRGVDNPRYLRSIPAVVTGTPHNYLSTTFFHTTLTQVLTTIPHWRFSLQYRSFGSLTVSLLVLNVPGQSTPLHKCINILVIKIYIKKGKELDQTIGKILNKNSSKFIRVKTMITPIQREWFHAEVGLACHI